MQKRRCTLVMGCLYYLGLLTLIGTATLPLAAQASDEFKTREGSMNLAYQSVSVSQDLPPIDAADPAHIETASFGLG